ncbi:hypothetical protein EYF80_027351 [Liparis tanakae]|uniref:Uncharacterized protein n=1 Tax=Liparis tanakae TaxID=230148 RepID=A0A4Z2HBR2_9TELE|nr:hypothetical protein EYF80_027351 [Liparis tanakae]
MEVPPIGGVRIPACPKFLRLVDVRAVMAVLLIPESWRSCYCAEGGWLEVGATMSVLAEIANILEGNLDIATASGYE